MYVVIQLGDVSNSWCKIHAMLTADFTTDVYNYIN